MLNILVPKVVLQRPRVLSVVGELVAARVPQHVRINPQHSGDFIASF
jgi:hypothetical protein